MKLLALTWERLARWNPTFAILTDSRTRESGWDLEEFFRTGEREITGLMARVEQIVGRQHFGRALDFGCGLGRLSRALACHAERVVGVDVSATMIERATALSPPPQVAFVHNDDPDLRRFADASFDLVCSRLVLQHMSPRLAKRYLAEFMRLLEPGGVLLVQLPSAWLGRRFFWQRWWHRVYQRIAVLQWVLGGRPVMEMHGLSPPDVRSVLSAAGGVVVDVHREGSDDYADSLAYTAVKRAIL